MAVMLNAASRRLGRYELVSYLGSGGMSDVYVALHTGLRKRVALKLLRASLRADREASERFLREGECAARVRHPNVVDVSDLGIDNGVPYLVMELLEGETLAQMLSREGPLELSQAIDIILPMLDAVAAVHAAGVLHRDVKPSNILLARGIDGRLQPKLVDFGIARFIDVDDSDERTRGPLGTPHYMAPEQARSEAVDERTDQYALGSVLFEMLTGREPYVGQTVERVLCEVARGKFPRLSTLRAGLPVELEDALARATQRNPAQRFPTIEALAYALVPFASERMRQQWLSRGTREGEFVAQLLAAGVHLRSASEMLRDARPAPLAASVPVRSTARQLKRFSLRALAGTAVLGLGLMAGMGVTRGFAESAPLPAAEEAPLQIAAPALQVASALAPMHMVQLEPAHAVAALDGRELGHGSFQLPVLSPGMHELRVHAAGHVARVVFFRERLQEPLIKLEPSKP
jgi:serine/threonine protein kinase